MFQYLKLFSFFILVQFFIKCKWMLAGCQLSVSVSRVTISANFLPDWISLKFIQWPSFPSKIDTLSLSENCKKKIVFKNPQPNCFSRCQAGNSKRQSWVLTVCTFFSNANWWKSTAAQRIKDIALASLFELPTSIKFNLILFK